MIPTVKNFVKPDEVPEPPYEHEACMIFDCWSPISMVSPFRSKTKYLFRPGQITGAIDDLGIECFLHEEKARVLLYDLTYNPERLQLWACRIYGIPWIGDRIEEYHADFRAKYLEPIRKLATFRELKGGE